MLLVVLGETPVSPRPSLHIGPSPDLAHFELHHGFREVAPDDELLDPLPAHFKQVGDLSGPYVVMHDRDHSQESTRHLTSGQALRETSHMTRGTTKRITICQLCRRRVYQVRNGDWYHERSASTSCRPGEGSDRRALPVEIEVSR